MSSQNREHLKYTPEHEWIEVQDDTAIIGITQYAQEALGDLVFIELPEVGQEFASGDQFAVVESVKAASEVYMPITGEVLDVNSDLEESPESLNSSPFDDGWLVKIRISNPAELKETMNCEDYTAYVEGLE